MMIFNSGVLSDLDKNKPIKQKLLGADGSHSLWL